MMPSIVLDIVQNDFLWQAFLGAIIVACVAAPLGCCLVWQRMVYFGDALSHITLLGAALGVLLGVQLQMSIIIVSVFMAIVLALLQDYMSVRHELSKNTLLGIVAHGSLALSLIILALNSDVRFDLYSFLFGDVLSIGQHDLLWLLLTAVLVLLVLFFIWGDLLAMIVHKDLAIVEGVAVKRVQMIFLLLVALVVSIAMKIVGVILIVSLLIIPPAAVRKFSSTPERMAILSSFAAVFSALLGLVSSLLWDLPAGPAIVLVLVAVFILAQLIPRQE